MVWTGKALLQPETRRENGGGRGSRRAVAGTRIISRSQIPGESLPLNALVIALNVWPGLDRRETPDPLAIHLYSDYQISAK